MSRESSTFKDLNSALNIVARQLTGTGPPLPPKKGKTNNTQVMASKQQTGASKLTTGTLMDTVDTSVDTARQLSILVIVKYK